MTDRVVTFDVWDTLLRRRCDPEAVKLNTCRALLLLHHDRIEHRWRDEWRLLSLRYKCEIGLLRAARRDGYDGEYTLDEVLRELLRRSFYAMPDEDELARIAAELHRIEYAQERFVTYPDPGIEDVIAGHDGARMAFLSDYHLPAEEVAELLRQHGFARVAEAGLVSSDVKLNKKSGRLYEHARHALRIDTADWLHVGDDLQADVLSPRKLGIRAQPYQPAAEHRRWLEKERLLGRPDLVLGQTCCDVIEAARLETGPYLAERLRGAAVAPLLAGVALWVVEQAQLARAKHIVLAGEARELAAAALAVVANIYSDVLPAVPVETAGANGARAILANLTGADVVAGLSTASGPVRRLSLLPTRSGGAEDDHWTSYLAISGQEREDGTIRRRVAALAALATIGATTAAGGAFRTSLMTAVAALAREMRTHAVAASDAMPFASAAWRCALEGDGTDGAEQMLVCLDRLTAVRPLARVTGRRGIGRIAIPATIRATRRIRLWRNTLLKSR